MTTANVTLYDLASMRDVLDDFLAETEGEVTPELQQLLDDLEGKTNEKIERVGLYVREQLALASAIDEEAKRLSARSAARKKAAEGLKAYLKAMMERIGTSKVNGLLCTVAIQANSVPSVTCELDQESLKVAYLTDSPIGQFVVEVPATYCIASSAVIDAQKNGHPIPDSIVIERGSHVRIR